MSINIEGGFIPGPVPVILLKEGATITIEGDAENPMFVQVKSSDKDVNDYERYRARAREIEYERWQALKKMYADRTNKELEKEMMNKIREADDRLYAWQTAFVNENNSAYAALEVFDMYYTKLSNREAMNNLEKFPEAHRNTELGQKIRKQLEAVATASEDHPVISFKQKGLDGKMVDIDALKGKIVVIDFWGSWCGPCRESHPHLKELYRKYKGKGLEIVGVAYENGSKDMQEKVWRKSIAEDGIGWLHVLNDKEKNDLVKLYGVSAFPTKIVVDRKGKIVLRYVGEESEVLDKKLKELLN